MEKYFQPMWMQTVTCLNALKSNDGDEYSVCNLTKVLGERRYLYSPACNSSELDLISSSPSQPAFSETGPFKSTPGGLHMWEPVSRSADSPPTKEDSSPLVKASCSLRSDVEASSCMSQSTEVTESSWILRTLNRVTFRSSYLDPYVYQGYETVGRRYLYAPPSEICGFVDEGFPCCTQIHLDKETKLLLAEVDEPPVELIQNHGALIDDGIISEEERFTASM